MLKLKFKMNLKGGKMEKYNSTGMQAGTGNKVSGNKREMAGNGGK